MSLRREGRRKWVIAGRRYHAVLHIPSIVEIIAVSSEGVKFRIIEGPKLYQDVPLFCTHAETKNWKVTEYAKKPPKTPDGAHPIKAMIEKRFGKVFKK